MEREEFPLEKMGYTLDLDLDMWNEFKEISFFKILYSNDATPDLYKRVIIDVACGLIEVRITDGQNEVHAGCLTIEDWVAAGETAKILQEQNGYNLK